ncbi:hypothetical protein PFISCL1PPCAC_23877, partial [Pristionchus fissidentatus]
GGEGKGEEKQSIERSMGSSPFLLPPSLLLLPFFSLSFLPFSSSFNAIPLMPDRCEACLITVREMEKSSRKMRGERSESQLIEWMESTCGELLKYHVHRDKEGIDRFQPSKSGTLNTIESLKERGVQVDLGFPDEFLSEPEAEIGQLKALCEDLLSRREEEMEQWYFEEERRDIESICQSECRQQSEL